MPSVRSAFRILLVLTLVVSTQSLLVVQGAFELRRDYIAERLCVNPDTDCDGTCYLKEQMLHHGHQHDDSEEATHTHDGPSKVAMLELALAVQAVVPAAPRIEGVVHYEDYPVYTEPRLAVVVEDGVFHPPRIG